MGEVCLIGLGHKTMAVLAVISGVLILQNPPPFAIVNVEIEHSRRVMRRR